MSNMAKPLLKYAKKYIFKLDNNYYYWTIWLKEMK